LAWIFIISYPKVASKRPHASAPCRGRDRIMFAYLWTETDATLQY
jgi:hypothetical protein